MCVSLRQFFKTPKYNDNCDYGGNWEGREGPSDNCLNNMSVHCVSGCPMAYRSVGKLKFRQKWGNMDHGVQGM